MKIRLSITSRIFLGVMVVVGVITGILAYALPQAAHGAFPFYTWPLLAAFLLELSMRSRIDAGHLPPLPMQMRFVGVILSVLIGAIVDVMLDNEQTLASAFLSS
jgi:hypothetical protein